MRDYQKENSYRNILRRLSAFGGVQMFNVVIGLIRGKLVALFLGPEGMGINTLYTSSTSTLQQMAGLGLNLAIVKEVAAAREAGGRLNHILAVIFRLILLTSLLGVFLCAVGAPLWSLWSFGDYEHTLAFIILSVSVGLSIAGSGYLALLQGLGSVKRLAKSSLVGSLTGLLCGVPLYWLWGDKGIVPALIILSFAVFLFYFISYNHEKKPEMQKVAFNWEEHKPIVRKLITLGLILMGGALVGTAINYLINMMVRIWGSVADVGLFQAANSLTNQYIGIIFSALAMDYFPRLSAIATDTKKVCEVVNRQTEIVMLVATPLVLLLIITSPVVIRLLLTKEFLSITPLMRWMGLGMLIQAIAFPIGYIYIAREDRKAYIWLEIVMSNLIWITASGVGYYVWGLVGLGISLVGRGIIDLLINLAVCRRRYGFRYARRTLGIVLISAGLSTALFICSIIEGRAGFILSLILLAISLAYSGLQLKGRLKLKESEQ